MRQGALNGSNGNDKVEALRKRIGALEASLAAERVKQQKAKAKMLQREFSAVGQALCTYAADSAEFHATLNAMLGAAAANLDDATKKFLASRGWSL